MQEGRYLLSIEELLEKARALSKEEWDIYISRLCELLDQERRAKVRRMKLPQKQAESFGAGLLLQYAVQQALSETESLHGNEDAELLQQGGTKKLQSGESPKQEITVLSLQQLLEVVKEPIALTYTYGSQGKPYLKDMPVCFNLSHSGEYIFCAVSGQEIGADIQFMESKVSEQIVRRFFAVEERETLEACEADEARRELFYSLWCRKEAYGKLTGQGVAGVLAVNFMNNDVEILQKNKEKIANEKQREYKGMEEKVEQKMTEQLVWEEYTYADRYKLVVCKWK